MNKMGFINRSIAIVAVALSLTSPGSFLLANGEQPNDKILKILREFPSLPSCAQNCLKQAPTFTCSQTDVPCLCKSEPRTNNINDCGDKCQPAEKTALVDFAQKACKAVNSSFGSKNSADVPEKAAPTGAKESIASETTGVSSGVDGNVKSSLASKTETENLDGPGDNEDDTTPKASITSKKENLTAKNFRRRSNIKKIN
ncbi:hypothetical protein BY996DRAFT_8683454 [Phakopsora pachyrhizi]|nr:hypothetical protein BY996DRAFT_8683454 [Phakopsora pachyrhizi]